MAPQAPNKMKQTVPRAREMNIRRRRTRSNTENTENAECEEVYGTTQSNTECHGDIPKTRNTQSNPETARSRKSYTEEERVSARAPPPMSQCARTTIHAPGEEGSKASNPEQPVPLPLAGATTQLLNSNCVLRLSLGPQGLQGLRGPRGHGPCGPGGSGSSGGDPVVDGKS
eukprot:gene7804-biopygen39